MGATIETSVDLQRNLTTYTVTGSVTADQIIEAIQQFYAGDATRNVLWNMTAATFEEVSSEEVRRIAQVAEEFTDLRRTGRTAIVADADIGFGLGRMFEAFRDLEGSPIRQQTFRSLEDALAWLAE